MKINSDMLNNTVKAEKQVSELFKIKESGNAKTKVLFLGNSITVHGIAPDIGWVNNWGMAASAEEKDYVHIVLSHLNKKYGAVDYCICNVGAWELEFDSREKLEQYAGAKDFGADIVIIRLGENVRPERLKEHDFATYFKAFAEYFTAAAKKVVITSLFWEYAELDIAIKKVAEEIGAEYVNITDLGYDDTNKAIGLFEHPGVAIHPGDKGMAAIAERINEVL